MKKFFSVLCLFVVLTSSLFLCAGCCNDKTNKIASLSYRTLDGNVVTVSSYYVYGIEKIVMCSTSGKFLEDITALTFEDQCIHTSKTATWTTTKKIPSGLSENHRFTAGPTPTGIQYYPYSGVYNCYVMFEIYFSDIEENYDITIKKKNGMMTITYPSISGDDFPFCIYSTIKENTITVAKDNVTIKYN